MKKFTFLVAALCATMMASAAVTFTGNAIGAAGTEGSGGLVEKTIDGVTLSIDKGYVKIDPSFDVNWIRAYSGATMTISATSNISKIVITTTDPESSTKDKYSAAAFSASSYSVSSDKTVGTWTGSATSVTFSASAQVRIISVEVTLGEGGEGGEEGGEESELDYSFEPEEVTTIDETMLKADWTDYTDEGLVLVWLSNEEYEVSLAVITTEAAMPVGTFKINDSAEENTVLASPGGDETDDYPSFVAANFEGDSYHAAYYLVSGDVTISVAEDVYTIKIDAKSYNGSTIKMAYTGTVEKYTAIRTVEIDNTVYARDGRIYAEEGARIYSLTGLDVTRMNGNLEGIYIVKNGNKVAKVAVAK